MIHGMPQVKRALRALMESDKVRSRVAKAMGEAALKQLNDGFRNSVDPYGAKWAPLARNRARNAKKGGVSKPLLDTGRLRRSFALRTTPEGFSLWTKTKYAPYHQYGTGGRKAASFRWQPTSRKGRFLSKAKAAKAKGKSVGVRGLSFAAGSGKIPPRMMVPTKDRGTGTWTEPMRAAAYKALSGFLKG